MSVSDNDNSPPVYQRLRTRMFAFFPLAIAGWLVRFAVDLASFGFDLKSEALEIAGKSIFALATLPAAVYLVRMGLLKIRAINAKSPLCPLCAARMSDGVSADAFVCSRCEHGATRAELKAAWSDVT